MQMIDTLVLFHFFMPQLKISVIASFLHVWRLRQKFLTPPPPKYDEIAQKDNIKQARCVNFIDFIISRVKS